MLSFSHLFIEIFSATFAAVHISSHQPQGKDGQLSGALKQLSVFYTTVEQEKAVSEGL